MKILFWTCFLISFLILIYSFFQDINLHNILSGTILVSLGLLGLEQERISKVKKSLVKKISYGENHQEREPS